MPASARISPLRGSSAATPPSRPASATTAASWSPVSMVVRIGLAGRGCARARTRLPATSSPPGRPRSCSSNASSRPLWPTGQSGREPARVQRPALLRGLLRLHAPGDRVGDSHERRGARVGRALGQDLAVVRAQGGPHGRRAHPSETLTVAQLREHELGRPLHALARHRDAQVAAEAAEDARVDHHGHGHLVSRPPPRDRPPRARSSWRWRPRGGTARRKRSIGKRALDSSLSRSCIARTSPRSQASAKSPATRSAGDRVLDPTIPPATSDTAASPASAGKARWVRRRRRSEGMLFTGGGAVLGEPRSMVPAVNSLNPP